jgi:hypothetical protein
MFRDVLWRALREPNGCPRCFGSVKSLSEAFLSLISLTSSIFFIVNNAVFEQSKWCCDSIQSFLSNALNSFFSSEKRVRPAMGRWIAAPSKRYTFLGVDVKLLPLLQPPLCARMDARTNQGAQRATQLRSALARVYAVSRQNQVTTTVP